MIHSKIILRSYSEYSKLYSFSPMQKPEPYIGDADINVDGSFEYLADCFFALFKKNDCLYIAVNENEYFLNDIHLHHSKKGLKREVKVVFGKNEIVTCKYNSKFNVKVWLLDIFSFNDFYHSDEDYDYGLFIKNVINDKKKQEILLGLDE